MQLLFLAYILMGMSSSEQSQHVWVRYVLNNFVGFDSQIEHCWGAICYTTLCSHTSAKHQNHIAR